MKTIHLKPDTNSMRRSVARACTDSYRKLRTQIDKIKYSVLREFRAAIGRHEKVLRLALNEAEALAWETAYPHLVFPELALEKAHAVAGWHARQQAIQGATVTSRAPASHPQ